MKITSKLKIRNKTIANRVVVAPMASQTANTDGFVTEKTLEHYKRLASSGAGLVYVEYSYVGVLAKSEPNQLGLAKPEHLEGLTTLATTIKETDAVVGIQLAHAGGKSDTSLTGGKLLAPSSIATPVKDKELEVPTAAGLEDIKEMQKEFLAAANLAVSAGFDLIELHAAHGYGLNQWLSPLTNKRNDQYGGSLENRLRIMTEIISVIRKEHPEVLLSVRMPGQDHMEGGLTQEDGANIAKILGEVGVDIINVSSGIGGWRRPYDRTGEGYLVPDAAYIQGRVDLPVIGVGGIKTKEYIETKLNENAFSLAAIGRAILEDPSIGKNLRLTKES